VAGSLLDRERNDSSPIHTHETPSSTSSCAVYLLIAFAEANTAMPQLFPACFIRRSSCMARSRCSRKFSSMMKKFCTFREASIRLITSNSSSPVSKKLTNFPLPPKNDDVVQKLHPMGQPTDGMMVAAV